MTATFRFVEGDHKTIEVQLLTIDQDAPHVPQAIDLTNYDEVILYAKQIGPRPEDPSTFVPKTFTVDGLMIAPLSEGYASFEFTPTHLDTYGEYMCRIKLLSAGTEIWSCKYDFYINVRPAF